MGFFIHHARLCYKGFWNMTLDNSRIDEAFYREKQVQGWGHKKKKALIERDVDKLHKYAECQNISHYKKRLK